MKRSGEVQNFAGIHPSHPDDEEKKDEFPIHSTMLHLNNQLISADCEV